MLDAFPAALGFKLPLDWRGRGDSGLPADAEDLYSLLAGCGYRFVEFATDSCTGRAERELLLAEARRCADAGLGVAFHPYLRGPYNPAGYGRSPEAAEAVQAYLGVAARVADVAGGPVIVNVHPAETRYEPDGNDRASLRDDLLERSRLYFAEIERRLANDGGAVQVVAEHQLPTGVDEPTIRIGDTCAELLQAVAGTDTPLAWDTGHYIIAVARYGQPDPPPAEFVQRVRHVHLHDVTDGVDHRVVGRESDRVRGYVQLLLSSGFTGTVTLEYAWDAVQAAGGLESVIREAPGVLVEDTPDG